MSRFGSIEAVLKITERCNINCSYCYIFNKESTLFERKPKQISLETVHSVAKFLRRGALDTGATHVRIIFHGGEPMMMRTVVFDEMCRTFVREIGDDRIRVDFAIQTNATLVDDEWIGLLEKYQIGVGISLDGPAHLNDVNRVDHQGLGTYERTAAGTRRLFEAHAQGRITTPAVLCVIDPQQDGGEIFEHLTQSLGFKWVDFLLPIDTRESMASDAITRVGDYLVSVFEAWNRMGDRSVTVRFFDQFFTFLTGYNRSLNRFVPEQDGNLVLTIASDGTFGPDDALRIVSDEYFQHDCREISIVDYLDKPLIRELSRANSTPAGECSECAWAGYCIGGSANGRVVNRYSPSSQFSRKSILCESLERVYAMLARALIKAGYSADMMYDRLNRAADRSFAMSGGLPHDRPRVSAA